jgi:hypothetical protein
MPSTDASVTPQDDSSKKSAGGTALYEKYGAEHMRQMGAKGSATIKHKYGLRFYSEIARRKRGAKQRESGSAA